MPLGIETIISLISVIFGFIAAVLAFFAWIYPRNPRKSEIPSYIGYIYTDSIESFSNFITNNDEKIVKIRISISMDEEEILGANTSDADTDHHTITLFNPKENGLANGGIELSINPEKGCSQSPLVFANGNYHINGFFIIKFYPGMWQGFIAASLTEVSAEQMALRV